MNYNKQKAQRLEQFTKQIDKQFDEEKLQEFLIKCDNDLEKAEKMFETYSRSLDYEKDYNEFYNNEMELIQDFMDMEETYNYLRHHL